MWRFIIVLSFLTTPAVLANTCPKSLHSEEVMNPIYEFHNQLISTINELEKAEKAFKLINNNTKISLSAEIASIIVAQIMMLGWPLIDYVRIKEKISGNSWQDLRIFGNAYLGKYWPWVEVSYWVGLSVSIGIAIKWLAFSAPEKKVSLSLQEIKFLKQQVKEYARKMYVLEIALKFDIQGAEALWCRVDA